MMVLPRDGSVDLTECMTISLDKQLDFVGRRLRSLQNEHDELRAARSKLDECRPCEQRFGSEACVACNASDPAAYSVLRSLS